MSENARYWIWLQNALGYGAKIKSIIDEYKSAKLLYELGESEWKMSTVLSLSLIHISEPTRPY